MQKIAVFIHYLAEAGFSQQPTTSTAEEQDTYSEYYFCPCQAFPEKKMYFKIFFS